MNKKPKVRQLRLMLLTLAAVSVLLTVSLAAAGASAKSTRKKPFTGVTITYVYFSTGAPYTAATKVLVSKWEAQSGATISLDVVPYADEETIVEADVKAGRPPAVYQTTSSGTFGKTEINLGKTLGSAWVNSITASVRIGGDEYNGQIVGLPNEETVDGFFVNVTMFKKAGVPVPTSTSHYTWQQFVTMATKVKQANGTPFAISMDHSAARVADLFTSFGYDLFGANGKSAGNSLDLLAAMKYFGGLFKSTVMPKDFFVSSGTAYGTGAKLFTAKEAPVLLSGSWQVSTFLTKSTAPSFKWTLVPSPCEKACGSMSGGDYMVAFKKSNDPKAALSFIKFMSEPQSQAYMAVETDTIPSSTADTKPGVVKYSAAAAPVMDLFAEEGSIFPVAGNISENVPAFTAAGLVMEQELTKVMVGVTTPQAATTATLTAAKKDLAATPAP